MDEGFWMDKKNMKLVGLIVFILFISLSGCLDYIPLGNGSVTYESHPVKVQYSIEYGYFVNFSGQGLYELKYNYSLPSVIQGTLLYDLLYKSDCENITFVNNSFVRWNISGTGSKDYKLGVEADVIVESFLTSDLNGEGALTLEEIKNLHPEVIDKYCQDQIFDNLAYLEKDNDFIKSSAESVLNQVDSNNSFLVAKGLFQWLKQNTDYQIHPEEDRVQRAITTYQRMRGDCDDLSFLYISLCRSVGIPARLISGILIQQVDDTVSAVRHAWAEVFVGGNITDDGWIPVECASNTSIKNEINQNFGVEDIKHLRLFVDDGSDESLNIYISPPLKAYHSTDIDVDIQEFIVIDNYVVLKSKELHVDGDGNREYK
jgi:hypothetical protein